jgi:hypothetical protein
MSSAKSQVRLHRGPGGRGVVMKLDDSDGRWPLERVLFALAGTMTLLSALLAALVSPWFLLLTAFVGVNQWLYVLFGACPASVVLRRVCRLRSAVYGNPREEMML